MRIANQEAIFIFTLMGQSLLNLQVLEDTLSRSITLKVDVGHPRKVSRAEVDVLLKKRQSFTLGKAVGIAVQHKLYPDGLHAALRLLVEERNWFIHKSVDDFYISPRREALVSRLKNIEREAHRLQRAVEEDLIMYSEHNGLDMTAVREAMNKASQV